LLDGSVVIVSAVLATIELVVARLFGAVWTILAGFRGKFSIVRGACCAFIADPIKIRYVWAHLSYSSVYVGLRQSKHFFVKIKSLYYFGENVPKMSC